MIVDQIPALQVVLALLAAPVCLILRRPRVAWLIALIVTWASLAMRQMPPDSTSLCSTGPSGHSEVSLQMGCPVVTVTAVPPPCA